MNELKELMLEEQPVINGYLDKYVGELPSIVQPVARHILFAGGKRLRPLLVLLAAKICGGCKDDAYPLACSVEMLHAATLLHDDVLDNATMRRSQKAAHIVFGVTETILAGDALLAKALLLSSLYNNSSITSCLSNAVMQTATGELEEFSYLNNTDMTFEDYLSVITGKTAWMLKTSCQLGALLSGADDFVSESFGSFGLELGIAFQITDDALDFHPSEETGKPRGGDLREGKMTPPVLLYLNSLQEAERDILRDKISKSQLSDSELLDISCQIYDGGFSARACALAEKHLNSAASFLDQLPKRPELKLCYQIVEYVRKRRS